MSGWEGEDHCTDEAKHAVADPKAVASQEAADKRDTKEVPAESHVMCADASPRLMRFPLSNICRRSGW